MTFSTIQTLTTNTTPPVANPNWDGMANDDVSVAKRLADSYEKAGIDPAMAYDDPETALQDFDLKQFGL
jgi:hypothetical protein